MSFEKKLFFSVLIFKIIILALFVGYFGSEKLVWSDSTDYLKIGRNIFLGEGFSNPVSDGISTPNTIRMPLYPFFVGFFDTFMPYWLVVVSIFQAAAAAAAAVLVYMIASIFLGHSYALAVSVIASFEPLISVIHMLIMPETFLMLFILLWMWFLLKHLKNGDAASLAFSVLFLALAIYTKSIALYLILLTIIIMLVKRRQLAKPLLAVLLLFILLAPWMVYNKMRAGTFAMTTDDVGNLCSWELAAVISTKYRLDSTDWLLFMNSPEFLDVTSRCAGTFQALRIFIREYPKEFFISTALSTAALLTNDGYSVFFKKPASEQVKPHHNYLTPPVFVNRDWRAKAYAAIQEMNSVELAAIFVGKILWFFVTLLSIVGAVHLLLRRRSLDGLLLVLFALYIIGATTISTGYGVGARLRYPIDPILIIFAAIGVQLIWGKYGSVKKPISGN